VAPQLRPESNAPLRLTGPLFIAGAVAAAVIEAGAGQIDMAIVSRVFSATASARRS
jgi:hypothetical protein